MANRKLPFGYRMKDGEIQVVDAEAKVVRMIFTSYMEGNSYKALAGRLNSGRILYSAETPWNKNNIARLLQDERYLGDDVYPPIIAEAQFRKRTPPVSGKLECPQLKDIRILARCAVCGGTVSRERKDHWRCPHCMASMAASADKKLMDATTELLQGLCRHPDTVVLPANAITEDEEISAAEQRLAREMERPELDESAAKTAAISLAAAWFDALGSEDYETMRIQYLLSGAEPKDELDTALLRQITSAILIHPSGAVSLKLKNGQIIERTDLV